MKRAFIFVMVLSMLFSAFTAISEGEENMYLSIVKIEDDCVWIQTSKGLVPFSKEGQVIGEAAYPGADCYAMADDGSIFYSKDGVIISPDENLEWETPFETIDNLLVNESFIIFSSGEELGRVDRSSGEAAFVAAMQLYDIELYDEDSFIVIGLERGVDTVERINCMTLQAEEYDRNSMGGNGIAVDADGIYLFNMSGITRYETLKSEGESHKTFLGFRLGLMDVKLHGDEIYVLWTDELVIYPKVNLNKKDAKVLTIVGDMEEIKNENRLMMAMEIFNAEDSEYTVKLVGAPKNEVMKTAIMANEEGYDILLLDSTNHVEYKKAGIAYDLSDNAVITENISHYVDMPFLWEKDGSMYGVPVFVEVNSFEENSIVQKFGIDIPENWTWEDFFALGEEAQKNGVMVTDGDIEWEYLRRQYACLYNDYLTGSVDYTTDTFRTLAEGWKALDDALLLGGFQSRNVLLYTGNTFWDGNYVYQDGRTDIGFPMLDGKQVTPVKMWGLYVNRYSENVDAAIRFLEIYSSPEVQLEYMNGRSGIFLSDYREYAVYKNMWPHFGDTIFPTDEEFEFYKYALSTGYQVYINPEFEKTEREVFKRFIKGELTLDEFISELQERADLMLGE